MNSTYSTPNSTVKRPRRGNKFVALVVGFGFKFGSEIAFGAITGIVIGYMLADAGVSPDNLQFRLNQDIPAFFNSVRGQIIFSLVSVFGSFLGGYFCARIANDKEFLLATILAVIPIVINILVGLYLVDGSTVGSAVTMSPILSMAIYFITALTVFLGTYAHVSGK